MAVNRYDRPAQQGLLNTYTSLPYQELLQGLRAKDQAQGLGVAGALELGDKEFQYLSADREKAIQARNWLDTESDRLSQMDLTTPEGKRDLNRFLREGKKLFGQEGSVGAMQSNYNSYHQAMKRERERLKKGDISQDQFQKTMTGLLNAYEGIGEGGPGGYNSIYLEDIAGNVNFTEWANKYGKDFESALNERAYAKTDGLYISEGKRADEVLTSQEIADVLADFAAGDDLLQNYLTQGDKFGYTNLDNLVSAIRGASNKFDVQKHTETAHMKVDAYGLDQVKRQRKKQEEINDVAKNLYAGISTLQMTAADEKPKTYQEVEGQFNSISDDVRKIKDERDKIMSLYYDDGVLKPGVNVDDPQFKADMAIVEQRNQQINTKESQLLPMYEDRVNMVRSFFADGRHEQDVARFDEVNKQLDSLFETHEGYKNLSEADKNNMKLVFFSGNQPGLMKNLNDAYRESFGTGIYNGTEEWHSLPTFQNNEDMRNSLMSYSNEYYEKENVTARTYQFIPTDDAANKAFGLNGIVEDIRNNPSQYTFKNKFTDEEQAVSSAEVNDWNKFKITGLDGRDGGSLQLTPYKEQPVEVTIKNPLTGEDVLDDDGNVKTKTVMQTVAGDPIIVNTKERNLTDFVSNNLAQYAEGTDTGALTDVINLWSQSQLSSDLDKEIQNMTDGATVSQYLEMGNPGSGHYIQLERSTQNPNIVLVKKGESVIGQGDFSNIKSVLLDYSANLKKIQ